MTPSAASPTFVYSDALCLAHDPGPGHPESPARLQAILSDLQARPIAGAVRRRPRAATDEEILAVHGPSLLAQLRASAGRPVQLDPDTMTSPSSFEAARLSAGAAVQAVEAVMSGAARNAFVCARPPGHHAEREQSMGFCLLNNVAIAAEAGRRLGAQRVLVVDWDVHHGNGTQHMFEGRRDVLYASCHQWPFYPGTGAAREIGKGEGAGYTVNCALPAGQRDADFGAVFQDLFLPIAQQFRPDLVLVSAGFDPHQQDPLGEMHVTERGFAAMTTALRGIADSHARGRLVLLLEGGYHLRGLADSVHACLEVLVGRGEEFPDGALRALPAIRASRAALARHWRLP